MIGVIGDLGNNVHVFGISFQSANPIDELFYKGTRLRRDAAARVSTEKALVEPKEREGADCRLGYEVTSQTQAVQSTALIMPACDWLKHRSNQSDTSCTEYCSHNAGL